MACVYDVALWRYWPTGAFAITELVSADSALLAALTLMQSYKLKHVAYAAVRLPDATIQRWSTGLSLYESSMSVEPDVKEVAS
jgi:hypothetical protein